MLARKLMTEEFIRSPLADELRFWLRGEKKCTDKDKRVKQQSVRRLYGPLRPAFADGPPSASADDTTLLTSFTPPSHSYKLFLTLHKIPYVN